jgi:ribulose-5-phosphate 4-epimerase/fuculose-1-phosphate aldolase
VAHRQEALEPRRFARLAAELGAWRRLMSETGVLGQDSRRYGGAGFGNVSARVGPPGSPLGRRAMLITGTRTGGRAELPLDDWCVVERYDLAGNLVASRGLIEPSSEAMTHGAIYDLGPQVRCVLHGHAPALWRRARELRVPCTRAEVAYGTPEMAREVGRLAREAALMERGILAMLGHEDGVVAFGRSVEEAGRVLVTYLARAYGATAR